MSIHSRLDELKINHASQIDSIKFNLYLFKKNKLSIIGSITFGFMLILAILAPFIVTHDPRGINFKEIFEPPSKSHFFGTDQVGTDIFSKTLYAGRYDLKIGIIVLAVAVLTGIFLGLISGYFGGKIDQLIMRFSDIFLSIPGLILAMSVSSMFKVKTLPILVFAISLNQWPSYARIIRAQTLIIREKTYIEATKSFGASDFHIIFRHILPNSITPIIVRPSLSVRRKKIKESTLSLIEFGVPPGFPE
jgi:peptide/nickel transport system permease protein